MHTVLAAQVQEKACGFLKDITDSAVGPGGGKMHERFVISIVLFSRFRVCMFPLSFCRLSDSIAFARVAREFVCASGGLERIAAALDNHEGLASVQHWALWALASIAQDSCFHHPLQERGMLCMVFVLRLYNDRHLFHACRRIFATAMSCNDVAP